MYNTKDSLELLMFLPPPYGLMGAWMIGMLYHSWGNHVNNFFGKSCFLKIKSVKEYVLFKGEVKCKLRELTIQVRLPRSEESHRGLPRLSGGRGNTGS